MILTKKLILMTESLHYIEISTYLVIKYSKKTSQKK